MAQSTFNRTSVFGMSFPALDGEPVMQGHADYCSDNGHAYNVRDGVEQGWCPRCGDLTDKR